MSVERMFERNARIAARLEGGVSATSVAREFGLTTERIKQIAYKMERIKRGDGSDHPFYGLSVRTLNVLNNMGCDQPADLVRLTRREVLGWPNCGDSTADEIETWLAGRGLSLASEPPSPKEEPKTIPLAIRFLERHGYSVIPPEKDA